MKNKALFGLLVFTLVAIFLFGACAPKPAPPPAPPTPPTAPPTPPPKTLKVGGIFSLTGLGSEVEMLHRDGAMLCQDWINEKGGITIKGEKYLIGLIVEDAKGSVEGAVAAATKLVEADRVKFMVGGIVPPFVMAAGSVTEPAKVLRSTNSQTTAINPETPYTFISAPVVDLLQIWANYEYLVEAYPHVKTVALIQPDEPGGRIYMDTCAKEAEKRGLKVVAKEFHPLMEMENFYPIWTKILAAKPDAVDTGAGFPIPGGLKFKQGREMGFKGPIFSQAPVELYRVLDMAGKELSTDYFNSSLDILSPDLPPLILEIKTRWEAKYKTPFLVEAAQAWDSLWAVIQAIEAAQSLDPTEVMTAWTKMERIETTQGTGRMGGLKTLGLNNVVVRPTPVSTLMDGKVKLAKWYMPELP